VPHDRRDAEQRRHPARRRVAHDAEPVADREEHPAEVPLHALPRRGVVEHLAPRDGLHEAHLVGKRRDYPAVRHLVAQRALRLQHRVLGPHADLRLRRGAGAGRVRVRRGVVEAERREQHAVEHLVQGLREDLLDHAAEELVVRVGVARPALRRVERLRRGDSP
jgi:hypothetical protein